MKTKCVNQQNRNDHFCSLCERQMAHGEHYWRENAEIICFDCSPETDEEPSEAEIHAALDFGKTAEQHLRG